MLTNQSLFDHLIWAYPLVAAALIMSTVIQIDQFRRYHQAHSLSSCIAHLVGVLYFVVRSLVAHHDDYRTELMVVRIVASAAAAALWVHIVVAAISEYDGRRLIERLQKEESGETQAQECADASPEAD